MGAADGTTAASGVISRVIAEKSGTAIVSLRLVPARRLRPLVPEPLVVRPLLPGLALYAVGGFRYSELRVGQGVGSIRRWQDVSDAAIMVPVRCPDRSVGWFVTRLFNSCPEVVEWAAGQGLPKVRAEIEWQRNGRRISVRADCPIGSGERLEIHGRQRFGLPAWIWRLGPLRAVARATLVTSDGGAIRRFAVGCRSIGRASSCSVSCAADGIPLPAPWLSFGCVIEDFADFVIEAARPA